MIALSTAWNPKDLSSLSKLLALGRKIGFESFELGISSATFDLAAVLDAIERHEITISSIHNVCSERDVPAATRRGDWVGEPDEALRREGVALAKGTLDIARRVGAPAVVLHGGALPIPDGRELQFELFRLVSRGADPAEREPFLKALTEQRKQIVPPYLCALEESLKELCEYAPDVLIGLENRYYVADVPQLDEFQLMFDKVAAPNLRYWHDVGHAHVLERIGFGSQLGLLERYGGRLAGMHLHDIRGLEDHRPPGTGDFNFAALTEYLRPGVARVMEIASDHSPRAVKRGRRHLAEMYGID